MVDDLRALGPGAVQQTEADVAFDGEPGEDGTFLEDEDAPWVGTADRLALDNRFAGGRALEAAEDVENGRLAAAGGSDKTDEFAVGDGEVDAIEHADRLAAARAGECHGQVAQDYCGHV